MSSSELTKEPESKAVIRFRDCDPFGHLHNSRYIDYFVEAREEQIKSAYGLDLNVLARHSGLGWYATRTQIAYLSPANPSEEVLIKTRLLRFDEGLVQVEGLMLGKGERPLKSLCWMLFRAVDVKKGSPTQHPKDLMELLEKAHYRQGGPETENFEKRLSQVIASLKPAS